MRQARVYWAARNLMGWWNPFGNHHFALIMNASYFETINRVQYKDQLFITLGGFNVNGMLRFEANNPQDVLAVKQIIDRPVHLEPSLDLQTHQVAAPDGNDWFFARMLVVRSLHFDTNTKRALIPYELFGDNCAAFVNSLFKACGVPLSERQRAGQFWGIDAGERLELPKHLFELPVRLPDLRPDLPSAERFHIVRPGDWLSKLAITYYGDMNRWPEIHRANLDKITDPNRIEVGQRLLIP